LLSTTIPRDFFQFIAIDCGFLTQLPGYLITIFGIYLQGI